MTLGRDSQDTVPPADQWNFVFADVAVRRLVATTRRRATFMNRRIMNIGIIGAGHIGSALAVRLVSLGHSVYIANSRGPDTLKDVA